MTVIEYARSIKKSIFIEIRSNGDVISSFGRDCTMTAPHHQINCVHGRGRSCEEALEQLRQALCRFEHAYLTFTPDFTEVNTFDVEVEKLKEG